MSPRVPACIAVAGAGAIAFMLFLDPRDPRRSRSGEPSTAVMGQFVEAASLDFGEAWSQPAFPRQVSLHNPTAEPLTLADVQSTCLCTMIEPRSATIAPGETSWLRVYLNLAFEPDAPLPRDFVVDLTFLFDGKGAGLLHLTLTDDLPLGRIEFFVPIQARPAGAAQAMLLNLPVQAEVVSDVEAVPRSVMLGAHPLGRAIDEEITLQSRTGRAILSVAADGQLEGIRVVPTPAAKLPAPRAVVRVPGMPALAGDQVVPLRFRAEVEGLGAPIAIAVPLTYYGLSTDGASEVK